MLQRLSTTERLANDWLELFNTHTNAPFRSKPFMAKYNEIDQEYKRLSKEDQEAFTGLINKQVKTILKPREGTNYKTDHLEWTYVPTLVKGGF